MNTLIQHKVLKLSLLGMISVLVTHLAMAQSGDIPRTRDGKPDFSGTYDVSTLTPLQRPTRFGNRLIITNDEAFAIANSEFERKEANQQGSDPNRTAPPQGGDGSTRCRWQCWWLQHFLD